MSKDAAVQTTGHPVTSMPSGLVLQRACACGGSAGFSGACEECQSRKLLGKPLQKKLPISSPGDEFEREADRVAEQVIRMPDARIERPHHDAGIPLVQRRATNGSSGLMEAPPMVHDVLNSPGLPLDAATRAFFEPRFGHDFGFVRVHADQAAAASANAVNALAYTVGSHIAFAAGHYSPTTKPGQRLIAHELSHVLQQGASVAAGTVQRSPTDQPAQSTTDPRQVSSADAGATQAITIGGETFHLVAITDPLTSESSAWRYRLDVQNCLSAYPNLGNGWWALIVRAADGTLCNIGGNCLGWAIGHFGLIDPPDEVWRLVPNYLGSIGRSVGKHRSARETYLQDVEKGKIVAPAMWDYFMAQQFQAVPVDSESAANLALYGRGFSGPMDGPSHIAFRTAGGELWLSKPSPSKPPIVHGEAAQMTGGETGDVLRLYACPSGPPNQVQLSKIQNEGSTAP